MLLQFICYIDFTNWLIVVLLGTTASESKTNLLEWMDKIISSVATEKCMPKTLSGLRDHGSYVNLTIEEYLQVLAKLSKPKAWIADIIRNNTSCGAFITVSGGGRGKMSQQGMYLGPFQT